MDYTYHTSAIVFFRKEHGLTQADVARAMCTTQSAVAHLEKRLLNGADITLSVLECYAAAVGVSIQWTLKPLESHYGIFSSAEDAITFAVHSSACEGLATPTRDIENLKKVARGEISGQALIEQYIAEALAKKDNIRV